MKESVIILILNLGRFKMPAIPEARLAMQGQTILPCKAKQYENLGTMGFSAQPQFVLTHLPDPAGKKDQIASGNVSPKSTPFWQPHQLWGKSPDL